jgi:hypothetical protein
MTQRDPIVPFRATVEDKKIIAWLQERLGISVADVLRLGIRSLMREEERKK